MKWFTAWRRRPWAGYAVVLVALATVGVLYADFSPRSAEATDTKAAAADLANGKQLFQVNCASCHGANAQGTKDTKGNPVAPSLLGVGAAAVDFQVSTGRMPAVSPGAQIPRKDPAPSFDPKTNPAAAQNIRDLADYIASLGGGPGIPSQEQVTPTGAKVDGVNELALGGSLFRTNCAQCHNFAGQGGALTYGKYAPPLTKSTKTQIYEAMMTGPQAMPVFNDKTITPAEKRAIIAYVLATRSEPNPGGNGLGRIGPVTEGLAGWLVGIGLLVLAAMWITAKKPKKLKKSA